ncbi:hypothetical protein MPSEU_000517600 [Mayamaea pseudoterrestris]|nr:hypothetical protein MPSEU_000517600 [Mayamaea pseudoterrestris]
MRFTAAAVCCVVAALPLGAEAFAPPRAVHQRASLAVSSTMRRRDESNGVVSNAMHQSMSSAQMKDFMKSSASDEVARIAAAETRQRATGVLKAYEGQSGASIIYSKLEEHGVKVVNGFSGGAVLPLLDQFHETHPRHGADGPKIRWITNSNENSSGHIAEGYAKSMPVDPLNLPVGVAIATSGPGVTNLITPLQDAICDGVPMVVLCGQAATVAPLDAFQQAPAVELTSPCTKWSYQIKSAAELPFVMEYAFYVARNGRPGPVFVDLPKDLQNQIVSRDLINAFVDQNLSDIPRGNNDHNLLRLTKKYRPNGELFQAIHIGSPTQGLAFEVTKADMSTYKLQPVFQAEPADLYHADHHPSNHMYKNEVVTMPDAKAKVTEGMFQADGGLTKEMIDTIRKAKKPLIIAGQGCNDCPDELKHFAETLRIPVTTTLHALGVFDERHELALNMMGMHGHPTPNFMAQEADLILCIGSRFDDRITGRMADFVPEARKAASEGRGGVIHVDIRLSENAKQVEPTYFVHSTGKNFLRTLNEVLATREVRPATDTWLERMKDYQARYPIKIPFFPTKSYTVKDTDGRDIIIEQTKMSAQSVVYELDRHLLKAGKMDDALFTTGVGIHQMVAAQLITWTQPRQMLSSGSLGTMGVSLGYAIGAKLANPGKIVISVDGDGSFNMTFTELKTLKEQGIPIKIMILDNDGQMMVEYWQRLFHDNRLIAVRNSHNPDYVKLAGAFGIKALYCDHAEDLEQKMNEFLFADPEEPVLFHVKIERTPCLPLVAPGQPLQDMILEDVDVDVDGSAAPS